MYPPLFVTEVKKTQGPKRNRALSLLTLPDDCSGPSISHAGTVD